MRSQESSLSRWRGEGGFSRSMLRAAAAGRLCKAGSGARSGAGERVGRRLSPLPNPLPASGARGKNHVEVAHVCRP